MFSDTLPEHLNANRFVEARESLSGVLQPEHYKRFAEMATLLAGGQVSISGFRDPYGPRKVVGEIRCGVEMTCQRCLQPVRFDLAGPIAWGLVFSEAEMQNLDKALDPILVEDGEFLLRQAIEDELVLLLPIMPMHDTCDSGWTPDPEPGDASERESPFAVLTQLKNEQGP